MQVGRTLYSTMLNSATQVFSVLQHASQYTEILATATTYTNNGYGYRLAKKISNRLFKYWTIIFFIVQIYGDNLQTWMILYGTGNTQLFIHLAWCDHIPNSCLCHDRQLTIPNLSSLSCSTKNGNLWWSAMHPHIFRLVLWPGPDKLPFPPDHDALLTIFFWNQINKQLETTEWNFKLLYSTSDL